MEDEAEVMSEPEGMEDAKGTRVSKSTKQSSYKLMEPEAAITGLTWVSPRSSVYIVKLSA